MVVNQWFDKRLALAHAVANTGAAFTPLLFGLGGHQLFSYLGYRTGSCGKGNE